jgi:hypothetical protein
MVMSRQTPSGAPRVFVRRAALAATGALLLLSGVSAQDDGVQSATRDMEIASMNAVQGGLSAAAEDLPRINTAASTQQQSALEAVRSNLGAHPAFQEFVQKHKGADHSYCPNLGNDEPCIEALRRYARVRNKPAKTRPRPPFRAKHPFSPVDFRDEPLRSTPRSLSRIPFKKKPLGARLTSRSLFP